MKYLVLLAILSLMTGSSAGQSKSFDIPTADTGSILNSLKRYNRAIESFECEITVKRIIPYVKPGIIKSIGQKVINEAIESDYTDTYDCRIFIHKNGNARYETTYLHWPEEMNKVTKSYACYDVKDGKLDACYKVEGKSPTRHVNNNGITDFVYMPNIRGLICPLRMTEARFVAYANRLSSNMELQDLGKGIYRVNSAGVPTIHFDKKYNFLPVYIEHTQTEKKLKYQTCSIEYSSDANFGHFPKKWVTNTYFENGVVRESLECTVTKYRIQDLAENGNWVCNCASEGFVIENRNGKLAVGIEDGNKRVLIQASDADKSYETLSEKYFKKRSGISSILAAIMVITCILSMWMFFRRFNRRKAKTIPFHGVTHVQD
jgi:hypothetical protein